MIKESSLKGKLRRLGSTPKAIAKALEARGIKGLSSCNTCPIANFLAQSTKGVKTVTVGASAVTLGFNRGDGPGLTFVSAPLPQACRKFIQAFDTKKNFQYLRAENFAQVKACNPLERGSL